MKSDDSQSMALLRRELQSAVLSSFSVDTVTKCAVFWSLKRPFAGSGVIHESFVDHSCTMSGDHENKNDDGQTTTRTTLDEWWRRLKVLQPHCILMKPQLTVLESDPRGKYERERE